MKIIRLPLDCEECGGRTVDGQTHHMIDCIHHRFSPRPGQLPPAAALVATRYTRTAVALPILWHAVTLARSFKARKRETKFWLALDVIGLSWSLLPVGKAIVQSPRADHLVWQILRRL